MKRIILTALSQNHNLWYEQFIPFIITLRKTSYVGDVGVINYGLSDEYIETLNRNNILIFSPLNAVTNLALDRHISASHIAKQFNYEQIAVFDADIWFPNQTFSLFDHIKDKSILYACADNQISGFIYDCSKTDDSAKYSAKKIESWLNKIINKYGFIWQLGLITGHKEAWEEYAEYIKSLLNEHRHFSMSYGIDTTLLNLYSAETDNVRPLHKKYNCIPNWEIHFIYQQNQFKYFLIDNERVEAIHIPGDFRLEGRFSFNKLKPAIYTTQGKAYQLQQYPLYNILKESMTYFPINASHTVLKLEHAFANGISIRTLDHNEISQTSNALCIEVSGESELCFSNPHDKEIQFIYHYHTVLNHELCDIVTINTNDLSPFLNKENRAYYVSLQPNDKIFFKTDAVDVQKRKVKWIFENVRLVE